ncbi:MAG: aminomethyl-transferring glycine dehydrogenase subunit GcvPB, partial [Armatimonadetes bacterium]
MPTKRVPRPQLIFEKSRAGRIGCNVPQCDTPAVELSQAVGRTREHLDLPEVSELEVIRHFTNLSQINYGIDTGFYPLGSCTMKYNPRINERTAGLAGFTHLHPLQPLRTAPGMLR